MISIYIYISWKLTVIWCNTWPWHVGSMLTFDSDMEASKKIFGMHCTSDFAILGGLQLISATESYHWWDVPLSPLHARSIKISQFSTTRCNTCRGHSAHREVRDRCFLQIIIYIYIFNIHKIYSMFWDTYLGNCLCNSCRVAWAHNTKSPRFCCSWTGAWKWCRRCCRWPGKGTLGWVHVRWDLDLSECCTICVGYFSKHVAVNIR